jgi:serine/threonine protein phosphatase 1
MEVQHSTSSGLPSHVPEGVRIYAIGDIHGQIELLDSVLGRIQTHIAHNPIKKPITVFLGDYVDRGPASCAVLERLINYGGRRQSVFLKGNHEAFLIEFLREPRILDEWKKYGGVETLLSYGLRPDSESLLKRQADIASEFWKALPPAHRDFLIHLKTSFVCGDYFFVHAGVRPGIALKAQEEADLLWIRADFLDHKEPFEKVVVHGHTPVAQPDIRSNRINIDTGAYATGVLTCLTLEADRLGFL